MGEKKKPKFYDYAEDLFINKGWTREAIAEYLDLTAKTVGKWAAEGEWENKRSLLLAAPHKIKAILLQELEWVAAGNAPRINADALSKISKSIEALDDRVSIQVIFSVFTEFDIWMVDQDPVKALAFTDFHKKFILHKINIDGQ